MRTEGIAELNWKNAKSELRMLREGANQPIQQVTQVERSVPVPMPTTAPAATPAASSEANSPSTVTSSANHIVQSPFVGTFYRSSSPTKPPFVEKGQKVKKGDTLCIVEAMKLMNEIESDVDGVITKILMDNESPVEYGEALFEIELT